MKIRISGECAHLRYAEVVVPDEIVGHESDREIDRDNRIYQWIDENLEDFDWRDDDNEEYFTWNTWEDL